MITRLLVLAFMLALAACAQTPKPLRILGRVLTSRPVAIGAVELSIALDWHSTLACANADRCHEANPVLVGSGVVPGSRSFTAVKSAEMAGVAALYLWATHRWPAQRRVFAIEMWGVAAAQGIVDWHNYRLAP